MQEKKQEKENREYTVLDEITKKVKVLENHNDQQLEQQEQPKQQHARQTLEIGVRRSTRISRPPEQYSPSCSPSLYYVLLTDSGELECYEEAVQVETKKKWELAMKEEMGSLVHNQTWDLVRLPTGKPALQNKWVYKLKEEDGGRKKV